MRKQIDLSTLGKLGYYFLVAFVFIPPDAIAVIPGFNTFYVALTTFASIYGILLLINLIIKKPFQINSMFLVLFVFAIWNLYANICNMKSVVVILKNGLQIIRIIGLFIIIERSYKENNQVFLLSGFSFYGVLIFCCNLISQLLYGIDGIYHSRIIGWQSIYVCGNDNRFAFYYIMIESILFYYVLYNHKSMMLFYMFCTVVCYSAFICLSDSARVISIMLFVSFVLINTEVKNFVVKYRKAIVLCIYLFLVTLLLWDGWLNSDLIQYISTKIDLRSLYDRGLIWNHALQSSLKSPIVGYGTDLYQFVTGYGSKVVSAHNTYLQVLASGGIIALLLFIWLSIIPFTTRCKVDRFQYVLIVGIVAYFTLFIVEQSIYFMGFYLLLYLFYCETRYQEDIYQRERHPRVRLLVRSNKTIL